MFTFPNMLSMLRFPLALFFLQSNPLYRLLAIVAALITDGLDGFIARRYNQTGRIGTLLDPIADKFFVFFALSILIHEQRLTLSEAAILICRDFSVILYGCYLAWRGKLFDYQPRAIWCGKVTTALQFTVLFCLTLRIPFPSYLYTIFILLGILALGELYLTDRRKKRFSSL